MLSKLTTCWESGVPRRKARELGTAILLLFCHYNRLEVFAVDSRQAPYGLSDLRKRSIVRFWQKWWQHGRIYDVVEFVIIEKVIVAMVNLQLPP